MKHLSIVFFLILLGLGSSKLMAQQERINIVDTEYQSLKAKGQLRTDVGYNITMTKVPEGVHLSPKSERAGGCACYQPHDGTYTLAMAPNDDGSTGLIPIPFSFCLYGSNYTSMYINNNGNVTFDVPYSTFSAVGFPSASYVMVAPFWADIDTRGIGSVWYKVSPTSVHITWEDCGYFNVHTDKRVTFSLIITDGTDPEIGVGNNVAFCYQNMDWTTGDASSGVAGFGGVPATVGCNKGDGAAFVQFGRFDSPGTAYFGPYATNNQVSWLDNQSFVFNACNSTNIAPFITGGFGQCDTIRLCQGDTLLQQIDILSPELGQITVVSGSSTSPDFTVIDTTSGNLANITVQVIGNTPGIFTATINAIDNGVPVQNVNFIVVFEVTPNNTPDPVVMGDTILCPGESTVLSVDTIYDTYLWNTSSTIDSISINGGGIYFVEVSLDGCKQRDSITILAAPAPVVSVPFTPTCANTAINFNVNTSDSIVIYDWTFATGSPSSSNIENPVVTFPASGFFPMTLTVTDELGCTSTLVQNIEINQGPTAHFFVYPVCISRFTFDPYGASDSAWVDVDWIMGDGTSYLNSDTSIFNHIFPSAGTYTVELFVTDNSGCSDSASAQVYVYDTLSIKMPNVLVHSSTVGNNKFDMEVIKPYFNLCVDYTFTIFNRWGVLVFETNNDPYNPDLYCGSCFEGKSSTGAPLVPGVYYYLLKGNYEVEDHGTITIFD